MEDSQRNETTVGIAVGKLQVVKRNAERSLKSVEAIDVQGLDRADVILIGGVSHNLSAAIYCCTKMIACNLPVKLADVVLDEVSEAA